jgi:hypothetical protein
MGKYPNADQAKCRMDSEQTKQIQSMKLMAMIHVPAYKSIWKRPISEKMVGFTG